MFGTTYIEVERPKGWRGEKVDMSTFDGDLDYYEIEVEGSVDIWVDPNYGADADGNRGVRMSGADVEIDTFTLYGDFRPFYIKVRDYFLLKWKNRTRKGHRPYPVKWTQLSDYHFIRVEESAFDSSEIGDLEEKLTVAVEEAYEPDPDEAYERWREDRW